MKQVFVVFVVLFVGGRGWSLWHFVWLFWFGVFCCCFLFVLLVCLVLFVFEFVWLCLCILLVWLGKCFHIFPCPLDVVAATQNSEELHVHRSDLAVAMDQNRLFGLLEVDCHTKLGGAFIFFFFQILLGKTTPVD